MHRIAVSLLTATMIAGCAGIASKNESIRALLERSGQTQPMLTAYDQGKRDLQLENYGLAIEAFQRELAQDASSIRALNGLAVAYNRIGRDDLAQRYLDQALALDSNSAITLNNLSYLNLTQGHATAALNYGERAKTAASAAIEMPLPPAVSNALSRNLEVANQLTMNAQGSEERQKNSEERRKSSPSEPYIVRVSDREWQLRLPAPKPSGGLPPFLPSRAAGARASALSSAVRVANGTGRGSMAKRFAGYLLDHGVLVGPIVNARSFNYKRSVLFYNPDKKEAATSLVQNLPFSLRMVETKNGAGHVEIILGSDLLPFDDSLRPTPVSSAGTSG